MPRGDLESTYGYQGEGCREGIAKGFGRDMYTPLYLKWITDRTYCRAQGTLLSVMQQPGWGSEGG